MLLSPSPRQMQGKGRVIRILSDDNHGSRHQRFIIATPAENTLLIAHNIDLAPRLDDLNIGDNLSFQGEYKYNEHGGLIHRTHKDPQGEHPDGWLEYRGKRYQ